MSRALILCYLVGGFLVAIALLSGGGLILQNLVLFGNELDWQKALRIQAMLQGWRDFGVPMPQIRMTYAMMDAIDTILICFQIVLTISLAMAIWYAVIPTARRLDQYDVLNFRTKPFAAILQSYRNWLMAIRDVWIWRWRYFKHMVRLIAWYLIAIAMCGLGVLVWTYAIGLVLPLRLLITALVLAALLVPLPWLMSYVYGERIPTFPMLHSFWRTEQQLDPAPLLALPYDADFGVRRDNTIKLFARFAASSPRASKAIEESYLDSLQRLHPQYKPEPERIDLGRLGPEGRLLYLPVAIDATNAKDEYDHLDLRLSDHVAQRYVFRASRKAIDMIHWTNAHPAIETYLGGRWRLVPRDGATLTLEHLPVIPATFPLPADALQPGKAFLGLDLNTGKPHHVALDRLSHTLIAGPTGMGKSVLLHQLMAGVVFNLDRFETVHLVDLKYGLELQNYPDVSPKFTLTSKPAEVSELLDSLLAEMDRRGEIMAANRRTNWTGPLILVVIDEFADMLLAPEKKTDRDGITNKLTRLTNLSRALGFRFWVQSQKFTADAIPTQIRNNLQSLVSFRMVSNQQAAMLFGGIEEFPTDVRNLRPGQVIYRDGLTSEMYALQGAMVSFEDVAKIARNNPQVSSEVPA